MDEPPRSKERCLQSSRSIMAPLHMTTLITAYESFLLEVRAKWQVSVKATSGFGARELVRIPPPLRKCFWKPKGSLLANQP